MAWVCTPTSPHLTPSSWLLVRRCVAVGRFISQEEWKNWFHWCMSPLLFAMGVSSLDRSCDIQCKIQKLQFNFTCAFQLGFHWFEYPSTYTHPLQWPRAFDMLVLVLNVQSEMDAIKMLDLKQEVLNTIMVYMMTCGYVFPVLQYIHAHASDLDQVGKRCVYADIRTREACDWLTEFTLLLDVALDGRTIIQLLVGRVLCCSI